MKNLKKDLQAVNKELKALTKKVDKITVAVDMMEKPKAAKTKPVKKTVAKKEKKMTATQTVLVIIKKSGKGLDTAGLKEKTGFKERKIWDAIKTLKKQGKIKSEVRGVYVKA